MSSESRVIADWLQKEAVPREAVFFVVGVGEQQGR